LGRFSRILNIFSSDKELRAQLEQVLGFTPKRIAFYQLALMHRSRPEEATDSNERLEFLGDAFLGAIVAEYLFKILIKVLMLRVNLFSINSFVLM
jgi:ribonuclease-3